MTNDVYIKAQGLADAIAQSTELTDLRQTENAMLTNEDAQRIIGEFQDAQQRLMEKQQNGEELSDQDKELVSTIEDKMQSHPLISAYIEAQDRFSAMLDGVNALIAGGIAGDAGEDDFSGCSGCGHH